MAIVARRCAASYNVLRSVMRRSRGSSLWGIKISPIEDTKLAPAHVHVAGQAAPVRHVAPVRVDAAVIRAAVEEQLAGGQVRSPASPLKGGRALGGSHVRADESVTVRGRCCRFTDRSRGFQKKAAHLRVRGRCEGDSKVRSRR